MLEKYVIRSAKPEDIDAIIDLLSKIGESSDSEYYAYRKNPEEYRDIIRENPTIITENNGKIIGAFLSCVHPNKNHCLSAFINETDMEAVSVLEDCVVDKDHRGNGLQYSMGKELIKTINQNFPEKDSIFVTVHPQNLPSVRSLIKLGFTLYSSGKMYENKERLILRIKDI
jgi:ribosomal protein S18 acetylase RimI-like enzyme